MNPAAKALRPLLHGLQIWVPIIQRSTHTSALSFSLVEDGLEVVAQTPTGELRKKLSNVELLGHTASRPPHSWEVPKRPCYWARQIISALLNLRGI